MMEMILNWVADAFARSDIIDLYFIVSDLVDIPLTDEQLFEQAHGDSMSMSQTGGYRISADGRSVNAGGKNIPIGKFVG